ncbi:hypothetical protein IFM89_009193 [Coptis chinensis]|uniref:RRM domain-containing protein n=1 Tax=Coptis chinensis TaxID=261450 RepID=A0A835IUY0_9MAGN|nr:hypothetical protein IFM89_009193 [Coptis chinensis]
MGGKGQNIGIPCGKPEIPLPADASNTPLVCRGIAWKLYTKRNIFRPFVGFKEVRLVSKEARHPGGDQLVLCFVDFGTPAQATTAMDALQAILTVRTVARPSVSPSQSKAHTGSTAMRQGIDNIEIDTNMQKVIVTRWAKQKKVLKVGKKKGRRAELWPVPYTPQNVYTEHYYHQHQPSQPCSVMPTPTQTPC